VFSDILFALWFFLPAGLANASPVFASRVPLLQKLGMPIDAGKHFRGKRIFGDHKTVRGFLAGILCGGVTGVFQFIVFANVGYVRNFCLIDYKSLVWSVLLGVLLGFGALAGDAIKSFFKRQVGVASGKAWFPFDQIDYIVGGLLCSSLLIDLPHSSYLWIGLIWFLIHPIATFFGWLLGLKDSPI
jgi:CDP-2,3-bis-(O-geranylgeranyl)-sn-glycerol synthase